ncbi:(2Fe-2S) ferredoxin domain-containing protein [Hoyosella sp. G463]|uniref:(2Fe-2S) ferredoxin domain-containing protein n=1 Tax=Lolliginicoccus lacisalsi TaxID=2742202 RepID=A0A927PN19_9ACTN|nr:(2Fe-2S) ferredoxin domain-containing protein [Lolliginicoccus lacisalsi]MBD8507126.1 (2Fe-2S) ferredoxin domain-containing protein [Lolliginicoccus lacisalsi]
MSVEPESQVVLVARPTPSGVDERSVRSLAETVGARWAMLDQGEPSVHDELDLAARSCVPVVLVPLAVPRDRYLETWLARAVANWRETRGDHELEVRITDGLDAAAGLAGAVQELIASGGREARASPRAFRSPEWSEIPEHRVHVMVCRGPRCTAHGAGEVQRALVRELLDAPVLMSASGCLTPCNLGPLVVTYPDGTWHASITPESARDVAGSIRETIRDYML